MDNTSSANETLFQQFMRDAPHEVFWILISILIASVITYIYRERVRIFIRTWTIKLGSEDVLYNLVFKYYFTRKTNDLNMNIYRRIKNRFSDFNISRSGMRPESMIINPENLGVKISIEIDCSNELEADEFPEDNEENGKEYQLTIRLDSNLRLTFRRLDVFEDYISIFEEIKNIVEEECFGGERERKSFLICDVIRDFDKIYTGKDIIDNTKNISVFFMGKNIKIVANKPTHLVSTIKKYIGY